jgi:hypothetical protein
MANPNQDARGGNGRYVRTLTVAQRDAEAARLRSQGWTYERIADHLGYSDKSNARRAIEKVLKDTVQEAGDELRTMERERLDRLSEAAWAVLERQHVTVSNGRVISLPDPETGESKPLPDDGPVLQAIDRLLRISESRRKLEGLDAPSRVSVDAENLGAEIGAILDRLGGEHGDST